MTGNKVGTREEWLAARDQLLVREKEYTRLGDEIARQRRALPWVPVEKEYRFDTDDGEKALVELFDGRSQLLIYHFMFGPSYVAGCPTNSSIADAVNGLLPHLHARDVTFVFASRAPMEKLQAFKLRMGWSFPWVSSGRSDFNFDFGVSFDPARRVEGEHNYNYGTVAFGGEEAPGLSAFRRGDGGAIYHTYSTYSRGLDMLNAAYQMLDLTAKGRDEEGLPWPMAWVKRHDSY